MDEILRSELDCNPTVGAIHRHELCVLVRYATSWQPTLHDWRTSGWKNCIHPDCIYHRRCQWSWVKSVRCTRLWCSTRRPSTVSSDRSNTTPLLRVSSHYMTWFSSRWSLVDLSALRRCRSITSGVLGMPVVIGRVSDSQPVCPGPQSPNQADMKLSLKELYHLMNVQNGVNCAFCGCNDTRIRSCSRCKKVGYCSREHQVAHWKQQHKQVLSQLLSRLQSC